MHLGEEGDLSDRINILGNILLEEGKNQNGSLCDLGTLLDENGSWEFHFVPLTRMHAHE